MKKSMFKILSTVMALLLLMLTGCLMSCNGTVDEGEESGDDTTAVEPEVIAPVGPKLTSLTLDNGESIAFAAETYSYAVSLPAGRPRIPRVSAEAEAGAEVKIYQATFADSQAEAKAKIEVKGAEATSVYEVVFTKDSAKGFELQFDDRYTYKPAYTLAAGESFAFESSDAAIASVDSTGLITAKAVSGTPVTITAKVNGEVKETLVIGKINKAQLSVFLIVGQSNAAGSSDTGVDRTKEVRESDKPTIGKGYCLEVSHTGSFNKPYDLMRGRNGFSPALAKTWYDLTGEKVLCVQSAVGGSPIENWEKGGDRYYGSGSKNLYDNTLAAYTDIKEQYAKDDSTFEIVRVHYYWCQGETAMSSTWYGGNDCNWSFNLNKPANYIMTADDYYNKFTANHANFVADMDVEIGAIMLVRCVAGRASAENKAVQQLTDLVPARAAQYALNNTNGDTIVIASRISDIARMESYSDKNAPGWGYMGPQNLHYLQRGYNAQGVELATNTFSMVNAYTDRSAKTLEVLNTDGRTKLIEGEKVTIKAGDSKQITAIVLPLYAEEKKITYTVTEGADVCSVDIYGMITVAPTAADGATAVITIESESGLKHTVNVIVKGAPVKTDIVYRWDFNDTKEKDGKNNLTDGAKSTKAYTIADGLYTATDRTTDFAMEKPIHLDATADWTIEWKAKIDNSSSLFGTAGADTNFIYLAFGVGAWNYPFRMVTESTGALMIPYGDYKDLNKEMNTWKAAYTASDNKLTLYFLKDTTWETVGSVSTGSSFDFNFTNLFGRFKDGTNVDLIGSVDYVQISFKG